MNIEALDIIDKKYIDLIKRSGLGLSVVKRIIVLSNGLINVESQKDVETTIKVKLPKLNQKVLIN